MRLWRRLALVSIGVALAVGVQSVDALAQQAPITLRAHHFLGPTSTVQAQFLQPWADKVAKDSGGRLRIEIYPAMQLGGRPAQLVDQVRDGAVDLVWTLPGYTRGRFPVTEVFELPFLAGSATATSQAVQEFSERHLKAEYRDLRPLALWVHAPGTLMIASRPVRSLADLKGLKIRAPHHAMTETLKALGASPVSMPVPDVYEALSRRVIDGAAVPFEVATPLRLQEVAKFHTEVPIYTSVFLFAMNRAKYEALPADLKKVIDANSGMALSKRMGEVWDAAEQPGRNAAKAAGGEFIPLPPAELAAWKAAAQPAIDQWVAAMAERGLDGKALLAEAQALIKKYSGGK